MTDRTPTVTIDLDKVEAASARSHALDYPRTLLSDLIEMPLKGIGWVINWLWIILVLIIVANVTMRYVLRTNYVWVEEVQWHIYAVGFMIGIGLAIVHDAHVRVDFLAMYMSARLRAVIEILGLALIVLPLVYVIISYAIPFVERSWTRNERSSAPGGLPHRWAIKSLLLVAFAYIGLAALARIIRILSFLTGFPKPRRHAS